MRSVAKRGIAILQVVLLLTLSLCTGIAPAQERPAQERPPAAPPSQERPPAAQAAPAAAEKKTPPPEEKIDESEEGEVESAKSETPKEEVVENAG